jgi:hypothetical protein
MTLSLKIFYVKHFLKQNSELMNVSFSFKNTKSGMLASYCIEQKSRFEFIWVIKCRSNYAFFPLLNILPNLDEF